MNTTSTPTAKPRPQAFLITEAAAKRIRTVMESKPSGDPILLVGIKAKGCSGMSYDMRFVEAGELPPGSETVAQHGVKVAVDPKAAMFLFGTTMDYTETPLKSGFEFINPNEAGRCGCGESFTVEKK